MTEAAGLARELQAVLAEEEKLCLEMRGLLQCERECLVRLDAAEIECIVRRKETLADEACFLEESRSAVAARLARALGLDEGKPTLARLCAVLGGEGEALAQMHSRLVALVEVVRELVKANELFAGQSLQRVQSTLELVGRLLPQTPTYGSDGTVEQAPWGGRLVSQAV